MCPRRSTLPVKLPVPPDLQEMSQMANPTKPQSQDFADIEDYFAALDEYYEATLYVGLIVTVA